MAMPWTCGATLPTAARYVDERFRRVSRRFRARDLDWASAQELVAFLALVPPAQARWVFHWKGFALKEAERLLAYPELVADAKGMVEQNLEMQTREDGLAILRAMQDGGFRQGKVPDVVRMALLDMRAAGISQPKIAAVADLTLDQVRVMANGPRSRFPDARGALLVG